MTLWNTTAIGALLCVTALAQGPLGRVANRITGGNTPAQQPAVPASAPLSVPALELVSNDGSIETYLEMRAFGEGLYRRIEGVGPARREGSFKKGVDSEYELVRQKDMERAYQMNISARSETKYVVEDRFRVYTGLYDNPLVQALLNRIGQSIVPPQVAQPYTFKLIADPVPWAEALSTGTVWVSTGLVSLMSDKAQLAYVLAHEAAHVYLNHHRQRIMLEHAEKEYNAQLQENAMEAQQAASAAEANANKPGLMDGLIKAGTQVAMSRISQKTPQLAGVATAANYMGMAGSMLNNNALMMGGSMLSGNPLMNLLGRSIGGLTASNTDMMGPGVPSPRSIQHTEWNRFEEDEADQYAFDWLVAAKMDIEQIPKVYQVLRDAGDRDSRITLGFLGKSDRVRQRLTAVRARIDEEKKKNTPTGSAAAVVSDPEFTTLLAEIKRDNGVFAFHHDMLESARDNLLAAVQVKTQDPTALYFYAKVLAQTARNDNERAQADSYFEKASKADQRNQNYGAHLHRALNLLTKRGASEHDKTLALEFLKKYLLGYHFANEDARISGANYPPHLESIYDYMARAGDVKWQLKQKDIDDAAKQLANDTVIANLKVRASSAAAQPDEEMRTRPGNRPTAPPKTGRPKIAPPAGAVQ